MFPADLTAATPLQNPLDGSCVEYPHRSEAMSTYRLLWLSWLWASDETRQTLQNAMDEEQPRISKGHGPLWSEFGRSLPGHTEFWMVQTRSIEEALGYHGK